MSTVTLNINDLVEAKFRKASEITFGTEKGSLGKAANLALQEWADKKTNGNEAQMLELLEKGFAMGKLKFNSRDDLHER